jgi:amino acid permease
MMAAYADKQYNPTVYKFLAGSSLYAYLSHYFFIIMVAVLVIRPYQISIIPAIFVSYFLTNAVILVSYVILNFFYELVVPPKKHLEASSADEDMQGLLKNEEVMVEGDKQR